MKRIIFAALALLFTITVWAQETPPSGLKQVNSMLYINTADSSIWHNKGAPFGWERLGRFKDVLNEKTRAMAAEALKVATASVGTANGIASLDNNGKVPMSQINDAIIGSVNYQGAYNAATNSPSLPTAASSNKGYFWIIAVAGTQQGLSLNIGDWIVSNGVAGYSKIDNNNAVTSVNGQTGAVTIPLVWQRNASTTTLTTTNATDNVIIGGTLSVTGGNASFSNAVTASTFVGTAAQGLGLKNDNGFLALYNTAGSVIAGRLLNNNNTSIDLSAENGATAINLKAPSINALGNFNTIGAMTATAGVYSTQTQAFTIQNPLGGVYFYNSAGTIVSAKLESMSNGIAINAVNGTANIFLNGAPVSTNNTFTTTQLITPNITPTGGTLTLGGGTGGSNHVETYGYRFWANIFEVSGGSAYIDFNAGSAYLKDLGSTAGRTYYFGNEAAGSYRLAAWNTSPTFTDVTATGAITSTGILASGGQNGAGSTSYVKRLQLSYDGISGSAYAGYFNWETNTTGFYNNSANLRLTVRDVGNNTDGTIATFNLSGIQINNGDLTVLNSTNGFAGVSPNGTRWRMTFTNVGGLSIVSY